MNKDCLMQNPRFLEFMHCVQQELDQLHLETPHHAAALLYEKDGLEEQRRGWIQSLGNAALPAAVRIALEAQFQQAEERIKSIEAELSETAACGQQKRDALDPELVAERLEHLDQILASENASAANVMLSQHIDGIFCDEDGMVTIRTCKLGALAGALELLPRKAAHMSLPGNSDSNCGDDYLANPRRRGRLDVGAAIDDEDVAASLNDFAVDPHRFAGIGPEWFTEDVFQLPERLSWAKAHAKEVAEFRLRTRLPMSKTVEHFGKTIPTIREALRYAKADFGIDAFGKILSLSTRPHWARSNAAIVAEFLQQPGVTMKMAVAHFGKSEPTIRKALDFAKNPAVQPSTDECQTDADLADYADDQPDEAIG